MLVDLPKPLVACDAIRYTRAGTLDELGLRASVRRATWTSGAPLYADVHVSNGTTKTVKSVELLLEKVTSIFHRSAPGTGTGTGTGDLRLPDSTEKQIVARRRTKASSSASDNTAWPGLLPHSQEEWTCALDVPTRLVTVETGMFSLRDLSQLTTPP